jgi:hypothetical protein
MVELKVWNAFEISEVTSEQREVINKDIRLGNYLALSSQFSSDEGKAADDGAIDTKNPYSPQKATKD